MVHCDKRGCEVFMGHLTHACKFEQGNAATIANVFVNTLRILEDGTFDINAVRNNVKTGADPHEPMSTLVCIETTNNFTGKSCGLVFEGKF
jgi:threonine aldolase